MNKPRTDIANTKAEIKNISRATTTLLCDNTNYISIKLIILINIILKKKGQNTHKEKEE